MIFLLLLLMQLIIVLSAFRLLSFLVPFRDIFPESHNEATTTLHKVDSLLPQLIDFGRDFASREIPETQLASLVVTPGIQKTICVDGGTEGVSPFPKREILEFYSIRGTDLNWCLNLSEFS